MWAAWRYALFFGSEKPKVGKNFAKVNNLLKVCFEGGKNDVEKKRLFLCTMHRAEMRKVKGITGAERRSTMAPMVNKIYLSGRVW